MKQAKKIDTLSRDDLLELNDIFAKNWLAHDGCWFLSIEEKWGLNTAIEIDIEAWRKFTVIEAKRLIDFLDLGKRPGLEGLEKALAFRLYAKLNEDETRRPEKQILEYRVKTCRVQAARRRKGLADFPCQQVGVVEYGLFARTIDDRIRTESISCPPSITDPDFFCIWRFTMEDE